MDEISAYVAYGIVKKTKKMPKYTGQKQWPKKKPQSSVQFKHTKYQHIKKKLNSYKSSGRKVDIAALSKEIKKPEPAKANNAKAKNPSKINPPKNSAKKIKMSDDSYTDIDEESFFSGSEEEDFEYTMNSEGSSSSCCSSGSSPESSPVAAAAAIPPASRRKSNQLSVGDANKKSKTPESSKVGAAATAAAAAVRRKSKNIVSNGDPNNNAKNKNAKSPAVKQPKSQQNEREKQEEEPPKKAQRKSAPSCPLLRQQGEATVVKSCPLPSKISADKRKSCPMPNKMAATTSATKNSAAKTVKSLTAVKPDIKATTAPFKDGDEVIDSVEKGKTILRWLINPLSTVDFFAQYWETKACQVKRKRLNYYGDLVSFKKIDEMLIENHLEFTTNIDLTTYKDGVRETLNVPGRAMPPIVWGHYGDGCSVRILNPSTYLTELRNICTALQEHFHCLVGANIYLTPPNSQGFAPHYDDIEAFVLQVEGRKRWRLYAAPNQNDVLARTSSGNLKEQELSKPIFDEVLEPGDLLYFPRGTVHQAVTEPNQHSLHITLSVYQQQAYANLLETLMPIVLQNAIKNNLNLRWGLPLNTWNHLGIINSDKKTSERNELIKLTKTLVSDYLMPTASQIDNAIDELATRFHKEALPPLITPGEKKRTIFGSRNKSDEQGYSLCDYEMTGQTKIRLLRKNIVRLVHQESTLRLFYYVDNGLEYCKYEANFMEIDESEANAIKMLVNSYPKYISINKLPLPNVEKCIDTATGLWERGLLITEEPFYQN